VHIKETGTSLYKEVDCLANIKSAKKRAKTNELRYHQNVSHKSTMRTSVKKFEKAVTAENKEQASQMLHEATRYLNKASSKGIIHKNAASRKISRLTKKLQSMDA
jgi:small subunit ribosomal protein S20